MQRDADVRSLLDADDLDGAATTALERYGPAALRYLRILLRDEQDAADAYSMFEEHVWRGLRSFRRASSLRTWIFRVARNSALDLRKEAWRRLGRRLTPRLTNRIEDELDPPTHLDEMRTAFQRLRRYLSEPERTLLILRIEHELPWADIARILSTDARALDTTTMVKRFDRLAARLRRMALQHGVVR